MFAGGGIDGAGGGLGGGAGDDVVQACEAVRDSVVAAHARPPSSGAVKIVRVQVSVRLWSPVELHALHEVAAESTQFESKQLMGVALGVLGTVGAVPPAVVKLQSGPRTEPYQFVETICQ